MGASGTAAAQRALRGREEEEADARVREEIRIALEESWRHDGHRGGSR